MTEQDAWDEIAIILGLFLFILVVVFVVTITNWFLTPATLKSDRPVTFCIAITRVPLPVDMADADCSYPNVRNI